MKNTLIIDGNNMAHRARYSYDLSYKGIPVGTMYGFMRMLISYMEMHDPYAVIVCWDGGVPEYRRSMMPSYKANRTKDLDDSDYSWFVEQMKIIERVLPFFGVLSVRKIGAEADDLMYHASRLLQYGSVLITTDKDLLQAVTDDVSYYNPTSKVMITKEDILEMYGVQPADIVHWRSLQGDSSDNIQGIKGIGEKTATKLFTQFGTVTGVYNAALGINPTGEISGKMRDRIKAFGWDRLVRNIYVMALYADRVGARQAVYKACKDYITASSPYIKSFYMKYAFSSLFGSAGMFKKLRMPYLIDMAGVRCPVVCDRRFPVA